MSKAVLISIKPTWCELIASGKKTVEVRKTKPKLETPFKVYIYATEPRNKRDLGLCLDDGKVGLIYRWNYDYAHRHKMPILSGKVIGEFVCDWIRREREVADGLVDVVLRDTSCVSARELVEYANGKELYSWHISDLVIYDKPKELSELYVEGDCDCMDCKNCAWFDRGNGYNVEDDCNLAYKGVAEHKSYKPIIRPPQSWCYVEEADNEQREADI